MQSVWNYIRFRTRDSMLAGVQDALDIVEAGENPKSEQEAAARLVNGNGVATTIAAPVRNGEPKHIQGNGPAAKKPAVPTVAQPQPAPKKIDLKPKTSPVAPTQTISPTQPTEPQVEPQAEPLVNQSAAATVIRPPMTQKPVEVASDTEEADLMRAAMRAHTQPLDPFEARLAETNPEFSEPYTGTVPKKRGRPRKDS